MRKISKINKNMLREAKKKNVRKINHINAHLFFIVQLHASNTSWWGKLLKRLSCCIWVAYVFMYYVSIYVNMYKYFYNTLSMLHALAALYIQALTDISGTSSQ